VGLYSPHTSGSVRSQQHLESWMLSFTNKAVKQYGYLT